MDWWLVEDLLITIASSMSPTPYVCCQKCSVVLSWANTHLKIFWSQLHHRCLQNHMPAVKILASCFHGSTQFWRYSCHSYIIDVSKTWCLVDRVGKVGKMGKVRKVGKVGEVGKVGIVGKVGKVGKVDWYRFEDLLITITSSMSSKQYACYQKKNVVLLWLGEVLKILWSQLHHRCLQNSMPVVKNRAS